MANPPCKAEFQEQYSTFSGDFHPIDCEFENVKKE
jgi:hypothetical protein